MSKLIVALALCSSSVRAQTGRGLAKDNLSGGLDWSHGRRLDGPVDDVCEGGGPSHRFDSRLECCENLDTYDLDTFCTGSCPAAGCIDLGGPHLGGGIPDLKGSGCVKISDGARFRVYEGPWDIEVTDTSGANHEQGIQTLELQSGAHDVNIAVPGKMWQGVTGAADNLLVDIKDGGYIKTGVSIIGPNSKAVIQPGGTHNSNIYAYGANAEVDIKGHAEESTYVKGLNSAIRIYSTATLGNNYAIHVWNGEGDNLSVVNNGPRAVTIHTQSGHTPGVTCNGLAVTFGGSNSFSCTAV